MSDVNLKFGIETATALKELEALFQGVRGVVDRIDAVLSKSGADAGTNFGVAVSKAAVPGFEGFVKNAEEAGNRAGSQVVYRYAERISKDGTGIVSAMRRLSEDAGKAALDAQVKSYNEEKALKQKAKEDSDSLERWRTLRHKEASLERIAQEKVEAEIRSKFLSSDAGARSFANNLSPAAASKSVTDAEALRLHYTSLEKVQNAYASSEKAAKSSSATHLLAGEAMRDAHSAARGLAGSLNSLWLTWGNTIPIIAGAAIAGALKGIVDQGRELEYQTAMIRGITGEYVTMGNVLEQMQGSFYGPAKAAEGLRTLAQAGLTAEQSLSSIKTILDLSTIGEVSIGDAAKATTGIVHAFGMNMDDLGLVADKLAKAGSISVATIESIMQSMRYASTVADRYGVTLDQTTAALTVLAENNIVGSAAGTAFRNAMNELAVQGEKGSRVIKQFNLELYDGNNKLKSFPALLSEMRDKLSGLSDRSLNEVLDALFGERGSKIMVPLIQNIERYNDAAQKMSESNGFISKAMSELEGTLQGSTNVFKSTLASSFAKAFEDAGPSLRNFVDEMTRLVGSQGFINFLSSAADGLSNLTTLLREHYESLSMLGLAYYSLSMGNKGVAVFTTRLGDLGAALANTSKQTTETSRSFVAAGAAAESASSSKLRLAESVGKLAGATGTFVAAAGAALRVLGLVGVAVSVAVTLYELFFKETDKVSEGHKELDSRFDSYLKRLDDEHEKLRTSISLKSEYNNQANTQLMAEQALQNKAAKKQYESSMKYLRGFGDQYVLENGDMVEQGVALYRNDSASGEQGNIRNALLKMEEARRELKQTEGRIAVMLAKEARAAVDGVTTETLADINALDRTLKLAYEKADTNAKKGMDGAKAAVSNIRGIQADLKAARAEMKAANDSGDKWEAEVVRQRVSDIKERAAESQGYLKNVAVQKPGEADAALKAESKSIVEEYRHRIEMIKPYFEEERKLLNAKLDKGLIDQTEYYAKSRDLDNIFYATEEQAMSVAQNKLAKISEKASKESIAQQLRTTKDSLRNKEFEYAEKIRMERNFNVAKANLELEGELLKLNKTVLPEQASKLSSSRSKQWAQLNSETLYAEDAASVNAVAGVTEQYTALVAAKQADLAITEEQLKVSKLNDEALGMCSIQTEQLTEKQALLKQYISAVNTEMSKQAGIASQDAKKLSETSRSASQGLQSAWARYVNDAGNAAKQVDSLFGKTMTGMEDMMIKFVKTGKFEWKGLANSIIDELIRISVKAMLVKAIGGGGSGGGLVGTAIGFIGSLLGGSGGAGSMSYGGSVQGNSDYVYDLHNGGIAGQGGSSLNLRDMSMFANAPRYHSGGVVGLKPDEVPAVLLRGERVLRRGEAASSGDSYNINIVVNSDGKSTTSGEGNNGVALGKQLELAVTQVLLKEKRPGGLLAA